MFLAKKCHSGRERYYCRFNIQLIFVQYTQNHRNGAICTFVYLANDYENINIYGTFQMNGNNERTFVGNSRLTVTLGAWLFMATGSFFLSNTAFAQTLTAEPQSPAVLANLSLGVKLTSHAIIPAGQGASIKSLGTSTTHGVVRQISSTTVNYTPGAFFATLTQNSSATDKFTYCLTDNAGAVSCNGVTVTVFGTAVATTPPPNPTPTPTPSSSAAYSCLRNWYVSATGSDNAGGTSTATPWKTLQHADDSGLLRAGDCVNVANGTYTVQNSTFLNHGGNANSPTGYVVYRSSNLHGAKIVATARGMQDVIDAESDYIIIDGFEIDGGNLGLTSSPVTNGSGLIGWGHHFQALNNLIHDCGGEGIGALFKDWYWIIGNTTYNNAHFNGFQMSGISIYEPRSVSFTPTSADTSATYHIIVENNVSHDNAESFVAGSHTDGNGIILDDFQNTQSGLAAYPFKSLVQGNTSYNNGARGIHLFFTDNVTVTANSAHNNNLDKALAGTWRGELSNAVGNNNSWTNNQAVATSVPGDIRQNNTAVLDGHIGAATVNVVWMNNGNRDSRTGGKSFQIDNGTRAAAFPTNNPLAP
jgi:parallel beta-helix repeat protein